MKSKIIRCLMAMFMVLGLTSCYERIDAGYEGIKVNLYGDNKGIGDVSLVTGAIWYNPITTAIYEYPSFVMTVDYPPFTVNAKDGSEFIVDPTMSIKMIDGTGPQVFKKYRKELKEVIDYTLYNYVKDAFRIQINSFDTDEIVSKRAEFEKKIEEQLSQALANENFTLEQLTSGLSYPETIVAAVNSKNKAVQEAMMVENQVKIAEAEAKKLIVRAEAEFKSNELRTRALTPAILEQMWIEKWDGKLPVYGSVPTMFKDISK